MYLGFVALNGSIPLAVAAKGSGGVLANADALPTYRVYGPAGLMNNGAGTMALKDTGNVTGASNANPIVITSPNHNLTTGTRITIANVLGNTNANGTWTITVVDANTFSLNGSVGNGAYVSGGTWNVTGLYAATVTALAANGFVSGQTYTVLVLSTVSGTVYGELHTFTVV